MSSGFVPPGKPPYVTKIPKGVHLATCYMLAHIGKQKVVFQEHEKLQDQIIIGWELHHVKLDDGRPMVLTQKYNNTLDPKSHLAAMISGWRGQGFTKEEVGNWSLLEIVGKPFQINIIHEPKGENVYHKIAGVMPVPTGMTVPPLYNPILLYDHKNPTEASLKALPEWIQKMVMNSYVEHVIQEDIAAATNSEPMPPGVQKLLAEGGYPAAWDSTVPK